MRLRPLFPRTLVLGGTTLAIGCPTPEAQPSLWICSSQACVEDALDADEVPDSADACADLSTVAPGVGFYVLHVVPEKVALADDAKGQLVVETMCDRRELELEYSQYPDAKTRASVVPLLATDELACGATIRATLFDSASACVRPLDADPTSCAALLEDCEPSESDEADASGESTTTSGATTTSSAASSDTGSSTGG